MKITRYSGPRLGSLGASIGGDPADPPGAPPGPDCCDTGETPPDRGLEESGATAFSLASPTTPGFVQSNETINSTVDAFISVTLPAPPTPGNVMVAVVTQRDVGGIGVTPTGWAVIEDASTDISNGGTSVMYYRVVQFGDSDTLTVNKSGSRRAGMWLAEFGMGAFVEAIKLDNQTPGTALSIGPVTVDADDSVIVAAFVQASTDATYTPGSGYTEIEQGGMDISVGPSWFGEHDTVLLGSRSAAATSDISEDWGAILAVFSPPGDPTWIIPQPNAIDGDDATYAGPFTGTDVLRIDLGAAFRIVRSRLRIACENAGSRTYTIKGANLVDFSDEVTLGSVTFTATGSYTAQDVAFLWVTTTSYRYFELSGTSESRRIHAWELYEETPGSIVVENPATNAADELQDALDDIYDAIPVAGSYVTTNEGGGEELSTIAASGSTETIDLTDGNVHDITLTADCTFTFAAVAAGAARSFTLFLRQDGTGGWTTTWPGSVEWGGSAPVLDETASSVSVLTFVTLDGGTIWYGFATGGGGTPATTVEDETTFGISPSVGSDTEYARQGHTHGTPANPVNADAIRTLGHYEIVMAPGITSPPEPVETPDGTDWVYAWVAG